jgi:hypothetical protein
MVMLTLNPLKRSVGVDVSLVLVIYNELTVKEGGYRSFMTMLYLG